MGKPDVAQIDMARIQAQEALRHWQELNEERYAGEPHPGEYACISEALQILAQDTHECLPPR